jgi:enoyl-CoA hydratase/carnithine racemase
VVIRIEEFRELTYKVEGDVATVTFNRPEKLNAFTARLYEEIRWAMRHTEHDQEVEFVVLTGAGKAFATGGDLDDIQSLIAAAGSPLATLTYHDVVSFGDVFANPKVTIAAINGIAVAGGLMMANACDFSIAAEGVAKIGFPEVRHGIAGRWEPYLNFNNIPFSRLKYILLTGRLFSAREAADYGLVTECVPDDQLWARVDQIIEELRLGSRSARTAYKQLLNDRITIPTLANGGNVNMQSSEFVDGMNRFADRKGS